MAWDYVKQYTAPIPGIAYNETELRCDFPNGARYRLFGADNPDGMRGLYLDRATEDEPADMRHGFHTTIILPSLADRQGRWTKIGTPKGHNEFYDDYQRALNDPDTFVGLYRASETGVLPPAELAMLRASMSEDQYAQELECSFEAAIQGAYFAREMQTLEENGQITSVPHDPALLVDVWFDLGFNDATSMWFIQSERNGFRHRVIRYYGNSGEKMAHYAGILNDLKAKGYQFGRIVMPHDAKAKDLRTGKSIEEIMADYGIKVEVLPRTDDVVRDIELCRTMLLKCWFDRELTKEGVEALKQYRKQYDDKRKVFQSHPYHDWTSNPADAFRQFAVGYVPLTFNANWRGGGAANAWTR
ncbi:terminase family protein [Mesorhizobium sp.]|uniref:terminase large subunit domain-containing protein n=1 Tax=Mesorhizobium sp. TaxID=1871066 RepID=UPI00345BA7EC